MVRKFCLAFQVSQSRNNHCLSEFIGRSGSQPIFVRFWSGKKECLSQAFYFNIPRKLLTELPLCIQFASLFRTTFESSQSNEFRILMEMMIRWAYQCLSFITLFVKFFAVTRAENLKCSKCTKCEGRFQRFPWLWQKRGLWQFKRQWGQYYIPGKKSSTRTGSKVPGPWKLWPIWKIVNFFEDSFWGFC